MESVAVILGSAFHHEALGELTLDPLTIETEYGEQLLHRTRVEEQDAYALFRHGLPHRLLPHHINYRAQAAALKAVGCSALLVTSSVGVLDAAVPLYELLPVDDLLMPENRLPDGSNCSMFVEPCEAQGHLVLEEGLFSRALTEQVCSLAGGLGIKIGNAVTFAFACGPRSKTAAENRMWAQLGAQVNSMTVGPEVVLANELEISCAALVVGHKYSHPDHDSPDREGVTESLEKARKAMDRLAQEFLKRGEPVEFRNRIYRFEDQR